MKILYYLLIVLCIVQDFPLANYIGEYGKSIVGILSIAVLVFCLVKNKKLYVNKTIKTLLGLLIYIIIYNCIMLLFYVFKGSSMEILGENIVIKSIKIFMYYFTNFTYLLCLYQLGKSLDEKAVLKPFYVTYFILFGILIIEQLTLPSAFSFLHATRPLTYNRIRLLTSESSTTSTIIFTFFVGAFQYAKQYKNKKILALLSAMLLVFIYTTTAKSLIVILVASFMVLFLFNRKVKLKYKMLILVVSIFTLVFLSDKVINYFELAYTSSTTIYTRGYTFVISLIISVICPIGVSNVHYLNVFTKFLGDYLEVANNIIPSFNSKELIDILSTGTDKNISAYSGVMQYGMYWGIIGNIIFLSAIWRGIKDGIKESPILFVGFIGNFLGVLTAVSFDNKFEIWAFIFVLLYYSERRVRLKQ